MTMHAQHPPHTHTEVVSRKDEAVVTLYAQSDADRNDWVNVRKCSVCFRMCRMWSLLVSAVFTVGQCLGDDWVLR